MLNYYSLDPLTLTQISDLSRHWHWITPPPAWIHRNWDRNIVLKSWLETGTRGAENGCIGYKIYRTNCLPSDSLRLGNYLCKCSDSAVSTSIMVWQCCVQLSKCRTMLCQTVQWLDSAVSISPMIGQCSVQLSDGWGAECPTVQWSDCALSNCPMVG